MVHTPQQEASLIQRLGQTGVTLSWALPFGHVADEARLLLWTANDEKLRFFSASLGLIVYGGLTNCQNLFVRQGAPLLSCINAAEEGIYRWILCC